MHRKLKVYPTGDPYRGGLRPQIKFGGLWLQKAGFQPHQPYTLTVHAPGVITLTAKKGGDSDDIRPVDESR